MAYEIPVYRFRSDVPREEAERMVRRLDEFLASAPGFKARRTYHDPERDVWIDVVEWESMELALRGMEDFGSSTLAAEFMAIADPQLNLMHHAQLVHSYAR